MHNSIPKPVSVRPVRGILRGKIHRTMAVWPAVTQTWSSLPGEQRFVMSKRSWVVARQVSARASVLGATGPSSVALRAVRADAVWVLADARRGMARAVCAPGVQPGAPRHSDSGGVDGGDGWRSAGTCVHRCGRQGCQPAGTVVPLALRRASGRPSPWPPADIPACARDAKGGIVASTTPRRATTSERDSAQVEKGRGGTDARAG